MNAANDMLRCIQCGKPISGGWARSFCGLKCQDKFNEENPAPVGDTDPSDWGP